MDNKGTTIRLRVSPEVARIVGKNVPRDLQLNAARGTLPLKGKDLLTCLFFLVHGSDREIRTAALATLRGLPETMLAGVVKDPELHPRLLDLVARSRLKEAAVMEPLLFNSATSDATLIFVASRGDAALVSLIAHNDQRLLQTPEIVTAILENPNTDRALKFRLGWREEPVVPTSFEEGEAAPEQAETEENYPPEDAADDQEMVISMDDESLSKYQMALDMGVSEKIKMALTGDKEWRGIFIKDANKLVSGAVMKNPRITEGEVLSVAKNKSSSDDLIRLITLNREWVKNYEIKKALVMHPRTPLPKALRYMNILSEKDLKGLAKSRTVSQVIVNNARRMLMAKEQKR